MTVTVDVQWALHGRTSVKAGFRVLSCSKGRLTRDNFSAAIGRFSPGTPDTLPQVTVSYVASGSSDDNYMALAIHKFADDPDVRLDETGRLAVFTSYFCVPYLPLAGAAMDYLPLYRALRSIKLPAQAGPPLRITLTEAAAGTATSASGALAKQVASLLLTGNPVCVLGASSASVTERLQFVDTVMAQLDYGYRARMTAATWVRPTHRDHRFRLYFSDAARDHDPPDHVVWWDRPEQTDLTPAHGTAFEYRRFLEDEARQSAAHLSGRTNPHGFKLDAVREVLADLGITPTGPDPAEDDEPAEPAPPGPATAGGGPDRREALLAECAEHANGRHPADLRTAITRLNAQARSRTTAEERGRYRELITQLGLFKPNRVPDPLAAKLYDALLSLAFAKPLSYESYCQLEDCLADPPGPPPGKILLEAIGRYGMADVFVMAIVFTHLGEEQELRNQFASPRFNVEQLIDLLARRWERPRHFRIACDVTLDYLTVARTRYEPATLRRTLRQHGFLAWALLASGSRDQYQVHALYRLLQAAYPDRLNRTAVTAILRVNPHRPVTPALFAAVLMRLASLEDAQLVRDAYTVASLTGLDFDPPTASRIEQLLPLLDQSSGSFLKARSPRLGASSSGPLDDAPGPGT